MQSMKTWVWLKGLCGALLVLGLGGSCAAHAPREPKAEATPVAVASPSAPLTSSYEELDSAAVVLRTAFDGHPESACGLSTVEASQMLRALEARLDEKREELMTRPLKAGWPSAEQVARCEKGCHCGAYGDLFGSLKQVPREYSEPLKQAGRKASRLSAARAAACASRVRSFCKSALLKSLRDEAASY